MLTVHRWKKGDLRPPIGATLCEQDGRTRVNLSMATQVVCRVLTSRGVPVIDDKAAMIDNAAQGHVIYDPEQGDSDVVGTHRLYFLVHWAGGDVETFPNGGHDTLIIEAH